MGSVWFLISRGLVSPQPSRLAGARPEPFSPMYSVPRLPAPMSLPEIEEKKNQLSPCF